MKTIAESLAEDVLQIKADVRQLLEHSGMHPRERIDGFVFVDFSGDHYWNELPIDARRLQSKILKDYRLYRDLVQALIRGLTDRSRQVFSEADEFITRHLQQQGSTWCKTPQAAFEKIADQFDRIDAVIEQLHSPDGASLVVPDTNALLACPCFDHWAFDWCEDFELIFTPPVLAELDDLKISHRNPDVREKAESVIRRIKELGRRGDLIAGVPVVKGRILARSVAIEPRVSDTLPWLDPDNNDDRFLASVVELLRDSIRSTVMVVTADINLQNKARFARLPFCEPPTTA